MPRAFLVLNKKTKSKHRKSTSEDEHALVKDENQNVHERLNHRGSDEELVEVVKTHYESENEEDIEIDVEGPCPVHEELILPQHHSERDSVTSVSPGSSNSLQYHRTTQLNNSYSCHGSRSSSPSPTNFCSFGGDHKSTEESCEIRGKLH